jgi:mannose-6-phosphate isomerase-like protein (cupin superfamily)
MSNSEKNNFHHSLSDKGGNVVNSRKDRNFVEKVWGWEDWIANTPLYCGKKMFLKKDHHCSYHYHKVKDETFYIQSGSMLLKYGKDDNYAEAKEVVLTAGDSFCVPVGLRHQFQGLEDTEFFEFSTQHFDEDSIRITASGKVN